MEKEFVKYEQALTLKELGFDEDCFGFYNLTITKTVIMNNNSYGGFGLTQDHIIAAPLYQQAFRWFRKEYKLNGLLNHYPNTKLWDYSVHNLEWSGKELVEYIKTEDRSVKYSTYEEVEQTCLDKLIEICKNK